MSKLALISIRRGLLLLSLIALTLAASVPGAEAIVCGRGVYRAGCVGPRGAVVVRRPIYHHHHGCFWRAGVRICR
jgi:hypothetical protein